MPQPGELDATDEALLAEIRGGFESVGALYEAVRLKAALQEARRLSQRVNQYLNEKEPWRTFQTDPETTATTVYVTLQAIDWLKLLWAPILPHSSEELHQYLGYSEPLFGKLDTAGVEDNRGSHLVLRYDHGGVHAGPGRRSRWRPVNSCGNRRHFLPSWILLSCWVRRTGSA